MRREFLQVAEDFLRNRALRVSVAAIELVAALFLILLHEDRSGFAAHAILWLGWLAFLEGVMYMLVTDQHARALTAVRDLRLPRRKGQPVLAA